MKKRASRGALTVEAAIVVPLFIMLMLLINGVFVMFWGQQIMTNALIQCTKSLSFDPYSSQRVSEAESESLMGMISDLFSFASSNHTSTEQWYKEGGDLEGVISDRFSAYLRSDKGDADALLESIGVEGGLGGLDFSGSKVENGVLTVQLTYTQNFVFDATGLGSFKRSISVQVNLFNYITS